MTRDEVARECERHGWELDEQVLVVNDYTGQRRETLFTILVPIGEGKRRAAATRNEPYPAYLEACAAEGKSPF